MWLWLSVFSALLLGVYDIAKKRALKRNGVYWILVGTTGLTSVFLSPFLSAGPFSDHLSLMLKAVLVSVSWVSGLKAMERLPLTTVSTIKASRPMFVVIFSIILFGERLNFWQWMGVAVVMAALFLSTRSRRHETDKENSTKGVMFMVVSVLSGAASALYDKHILRISDALFVQCWSNFYITLVLGLAVLVKSLADGGKRERFEWDWMLPVIAVLITGSDFLYFHAIQQGDALLAVISMLRRCSIVVTFALGAWLFKEKRVREKALEMLLIVAGMAFLVFGS